MVSAVTQCEFDWFTTDYVQQKLEDQALRGHSRDILMKRVYITIAFFTALENLLSYQSLTFQLRDILTACVPAQRYKPLFPLTSLSSATTLTNTMAPKYARDQPAAFTNRIENVAIVGVSPRLSTLC